MRVCIDVDRAPKVLFMHVSCIKIDADIRRLAFGKLLLLEFGSDAVAGGRDGDDHELLVASIAIDKVEGVERAVSVQRHVADGVIKDDVRLCRFPARASEEKAELNAKHGENEQSGMTHK